MARSSRDRAASSLSRNETLRKRSPAREIAEIAGNFIELA
jgi:hypothetical protein